MIGYNLFVFAVYVVDKYKARHDRWRIPEATLLWLAALGGGAGALVGVYKIRHKNRKPRFAYGVPLMLMAQVALGLWLFRKL